MRCPKCGAYAKQNNPCAKCGNKNTTAPAVPIAPTVATVINGTYKVGDKVKVKSLEWYADMMKKNGPTIHFKYDSFIPDMKKFCGKELQIAKVILDGRKYRVVENSFNWTEEMFES